MYMQVNQENGIIYYSLPKGTVLYRGDSGSNSEIMSLENIITFFGFDKENVEENYGVTYEFKTNKKLKLIALDKIGLDNDSKTNFLAIIKKKCGKNEEEYEKIKRILYENYGYKNGIRTSVSKNDKTISQFICEEFKDYQGYACEEMKTDFGGIFHSEAMICKPNDNLVGGKIVTEESKIIGMREKHTERSQRPPVEKKTKSRIFDKDESSEDERSNSIFFDNYESSEDESLSRDLNLEKRRMSEDDDYDTPPKRLFGGKNGGKNGVKRKTKKQKTNSRRKNKKKTRKQRFK